ncbi:hypothetical protein FDA09_08570 [Clostridium botulinum]|uniref:SAF domain-containing protein n=1 Tax=Clostridium botulinum TaxID=1491 RepID=UPI000774BA7E|nr:SAF domain-containing protein [Clostridium botulinum]MBN1057662.1 hypothetical protein [Clostridium botulinum]MBN1060907.1 hypothetical protein [Clostridium botulinum]NFE95095.1 hypothetical protein [Clostridium botulinum]NFH79855.1 hypothetical protein [Clostridium botulinum]NFH82300.1 hypothetical protein [Clostridium botulinum]
MNIKESSNIVCSIRDIEKGEMFTEDNIKSIRPGLGLKPKYINDVIGKISNVDIEKRTPMQWGFIK